MAKMTAEEIRKAAEQGFDRAQHNLGVMYANGRGVPKDYVRAHAYLNIAAAQGNDISRRWRDTLGKNMTPEQIAKAQRLADECANMDYKGCKF